MTPPEAALVLTKCCAYDQRTIGEADVIAWHEVLGDLRLVDCLAAVAAWYRDHRERIMPADIRRGVKVIRDGRLRACPPDRELMAGVDPDIEGEEWVRIYRERRQMVADGGSPTQLAVASGGAQ